VKAVATDGRGGLRLVEVPHPVAPEAGALVRVVACGFCGSDLTKVDDPGSSAGRILGHEVVGFLERPGEEAVRVALAHHVPCGRCERCRAGHSSLCDQFVRYDLDPGGFVETLAVNSLHLADSVFALSPQVSDLDGTLLEPLSCVLRALDVAAGLWPAYPLPHVGGASGRRNSFRPRVLVAGCGSVGLLFLSVLRLLREGIEAPGLEGLLGRLRPRELLFLERDEHRASLAAGLGAVHAATTPAPSSADLCFLTAPGALPAALELVAPGGIVVVFAAPSEPVQMELDLVYRREITMAGVRSGSPGHLRRALALLEGGRLPIEWLRPEVVGLDGLSDAVERYRRGEVLKVVVRP